MPNRRTVSLLNRTRPKRSRGATQVQSPSRYSAGYPRVSNGTPGSGCCPVRLTILEKEAVPMRSQPLLGEASRRRAEEQFKTTRKSIPKLRPTPLHGKPRWRKRRAYAHFGWPRKQPTRILQIAARRQRRPGDLSRAGAFENLRPPPQNPSKARLRVLPRRLRWVPRGDPNGKIGIVQMADNAAAEKSGTVEYSHASRKHGAKISHRL